MIEIEPVLASLGKRRPIFHSEADLQHELAHELRAPGQAPPGYRAALGAHPPPQVAPRMRDALEAREHLEQFRFLAGAQPEVGGNRVADAGRMFP